jgi:hypothetical protein
MHIAVMSKGYGRIERAILDALEWDKRVAHRGMFYVGTDAEMLVYYVRSGNALFSVGDPHMPHPPPTRSELESVRRALRNLRKKGLVYARRYPASVGYERPGKKPNSG